MAPTTDDEIYRLMFDMGDHKLRARFQELRDKGLITETAAGATLASEAGAKVYYALEAFYNQEARSAHGIRVRQLLSDVTLERAAALGIRVLLGGAASGASKSKERSMQFFRKSIGVQLKQEADFLKLSRLKPKMYQHLSHSLEGACARAKNKIRLKLLQDLDDGDCGWDAADTVMVGSVVLDYCLREAGLFQVNSFSSYNHRNKRSVVNAVELKPEVLEWITEGLNFLSSCVPIRLPITSLPLDWSPDTRGGYPKDTGRPLEFMTTNDKHQYRVFLESDCPEVYRGLNTIQRTPWRVNKRVADVVRISSERGWPDVGFAESPPKKPDRPDTEYCRDDPKWIEYNRKKRAYSIMEYDFVTNRIMVSRSVAILEAYREFDRFYYPHQIDFRGRCYTIGAPVSYQGPDFQRAALEFADAKVIGSDEAVRWFKIHGANCWGEDKVDFERRVGWVDKNADWIIQCGRDPIANRAWTEADSPFQFLAWCLEFADAQDYPSLREFPSRIPISMDGSNNGLQLYSLLLRDEIGGRATNCLPCSSPQDAYQEVADRLTARLIEIRDTSDNPQHSRWARRVIEFCRMTGSEGLPRKAVKRPVMTLPYGATQFSCQRYVVEWYHDFVRGKNIPVEQQPFKEQDAYNAWNWVGSVLWSCIEDVIVKATEAMAWLREASTILTEHNVHARWTTPLGMVCQQHYMRGDKKTIRFRAGGNMRLSVWKSTEQINGERSRNGLCPNYIHSLDASVMFHTVNEAALAGITHFQMIHDSFGTHAADAPTLAKILRQSVIELFSQNLLEKLHHELESLLPPDVLLPSPPSFGNLKVEDLTEAEYFFA